MRHPCLVAILSLLLLTSDLMGTAHTFATPGSGNGSEHPAQCPFLAGIPSNPNLADLRAPRAGERRIRDTSMPAYETCTELFDPPFDCACMIRFLQAHVQPSELEILVPVFAFSISGTRVEDGTEMAALYERYGIARINDVLRAFHAVRVEMFMECPGTSLNGEDED